MSAFLQAVRGETYWALDFETLGDGVTPGSRLDPLLNVVEGVALATGRPGGTWWVGFVRTLDRNDYVSQMAGAPSRPGTVGMPIEDVFAALRPVIEDPTKVMLTHGGDFDCRTASKFPGWAWPRWHADTQVGCWMADENNASGVRGKPYGLKELTKHFRGVDRMSYRQQDGLFGSGLEEYAGNDADDTLWLWWNRVAPNLQAEAMMPAFLNVEMACMRGRCELKDAGITIDRPFLLGARELYVQASALAEKRAYAAAGRNFNLGSPKQVAKLLYEELALPIPFGVKRGKSGDWPTGEDVLVRLPSHPVVRALLERRSYEKDRSTFVDGMLAEAAKYEDGRARFDFRQHGVDTGRWAASRIHQIPATPKEITLLEGGLSPTQQKALEDFRKAIGKGKVEEGRLISSTAGCSFAYVGGPYRTVDILQGTQKVGSTHAVELREAFVAAPGCVFVDTDWSQLQLRIAAHFSEEPSMLEVYRRAVCGCPTFLTKSTCEHLCSCDMYKAGGTCGHVDIHQLTADKLNIPRRQGKTLNFAILFGMGPGLLSVTLGIPKARAQEILDGWWAAYPAVARFRDYIWNMITQLGYVTTLTGRRRHISRWHWDRMDEQEILRKIFCSVIQGSEADIMMVAYRDIYAELLRRREQDPAWLGVRPVLQLHDEFLVECPEAMADPVGDLVREKMERSIALRVPLTASPAVGRSWAEAKG